MDNGRIPGRDSGDLDPPKGEFNLTSNLIRILLMTGMLGALVYGAKTIIPLTDGKGCITVNDVCQDKGCSKAVNHSCNDVAQDCLCLEVQ